MDDPATAPAASVRVSDEVLRRNTVAVVSSVSALVLVTAAVAIIAYVVLATPAPAVDPTERQEPLGMARAAPSDPPVLAVEGDPPAAIGNATTEMALELSSSAPAPTPTPRVMALPTVAVQAQPRSVAAAGTRSGERWGILPLGPFSSFGADASRATPKGATAAQAVSLATPPVPSSMPGALAVGTRVAVAVPSARLRGAPSLDGPVLAGLRQGRVLVVTGPPVPGSGYLWYPVEARNKPGLVGYVASVLIAPHAS